MNRPSQGAQLLLLDIYQRTKATTEEELITTVIPENIMTKLADIYANNMIQLERFLRKNILAVYFLQNLAIYFNNYYKYKTDFIYLSLNHPSVKTITSFVYTC